MPQLKLSDFLRNIWRSDFDFLSPLKGKSTDFWNDNLKESYSYVLQKEWTRFIKLVHDVGSTSNIVNPSCSSRRLCLMYVKRRWKSCIVVRKITAKSSILESQYCIIRRVCEISFNRKSYKILYYDNTFVYFKGF